MVGKQWLQQHLLEWVTDCLPLSEQDAERKVLSLTWLSSFPFIFEPQTQVNGIMMPTFREGHPPSEHLWKCSQR